MLTSPEQSPIQSAKEHFPAFWGGPDRPERFLRDLLEERIHAVPAGGEIVWVTYYFRDEGLAAALLSACRRGVQVQVVVEGRPRTENINDRVREILQGGNGLGDGFRALSHRFFDNRFRKRCRLHEKLYYFSHPVPSVLLGTFNPSGNLPEDPAIIKEIGDQDRGHNVLLEVKDESLVVGLKEHAMRLFRATHGPWERFLPPNNRVITSGKSKIIFFPRARRRDFDALFNDIGPGSHLRMAVSHLNDPGICKRLFDMASRGAQIEVLAHDTERRVPTWVEEQMRHNGIVFKRYIHPDGLPMHNKFMLIDTPARQTVAVGSMNLSVRSLHANHELLLVSEEPSLYRAVQQRWEDMLSETGRWGDTAGESELP